MEEQQVQARVHYMLNQMNQIRNSARTLYIATMLADMNQELTAEFKVELRGQFIQMAACMEEVKRG